MMAKMYEIKLKLSFVYANEWFIFI